jgi:uncharacterized membrane protein
MSTAELILLAFLIGIVAGLRALTAPMVVSWAAYLGWIDVRHSWAGWLAHLVTAIILTALALGELVNDQNPKAPARTAPPSFFGRLVTGAFAGAALATGSGHPALAGVALGALGAAVGTLGGYRARTGLVKRLGVKDVVIALPEDALAVGGGFAITALFR